MSTLLSAGRVLGGWHSCRGHGRSGPPLAPILTLHISSTELLPSCSLYNKPANSSKVFSWQRLRPTQHRLLPGVQQGPGNVSEAGPRTWGPVGAAASCWLWSDLVRSLDSVRDTGLSQAMQLRAGLCLRKKLKGLPLGCRGGWGWRWGDGSPLHLLILRSPS